MSDKKWMEMNAKIEQEGYEWVGAAFMPSDDDDGPECPTCGEQGFWVVQYAKPHRQFEGVMANQCYDCGHMWVDRYSDEADETP